MARSGCRALREGDDGFPLVMVLPGRSIREGDAVGGWWRFGFSGPGAPRRALGAGGVPRSTFYYQPR